MGQTNFAEAADSGAAQCSESRRSAMMEEDVDWDDILPQPAVGLNHTGDGEDGDGIGRALMPHTRTPPVSPPVPQRQARSKRGDIKSRWRTVLPAPRQRMRDQQLLAASRMRDSRHAKFRSKQTKGNKANVDRGLDLLRRAGLLRDEQRTLVRIGRNASVQFTTPLHKKIRVPYQTMLKVAYGTFSRRNQAAKAHDLDPRTVTRMKVLTASCHDKSDEGFLDQLRTNFARNPPLIWAAGMSADCTTQMVNLPMIGLEHLPHLTRSSWHVMVSQYRISWTNYELQWFVCDFVRPNVPLVSSESGGTMWQSLYHVPQVRAFTECENAGVEHAALAFLHFDLDGAASNGRMVLERRTELIKTSGKLPMVSMRLCDL